MTLKPANYKYRRTNGTSLTGENGMGYVYAEIELTSGDDLALNRHGLLPEDEIRKVTTRALVDSGAWDLVLNEDVRKRLNLPVLDRRTVTLADETVLEVDVVGPVQIRFQNRATTILAIVLPNTSEVLLGAYALEGLDAFIDPKRERLLVHPDDIKLLKRVA
ncbi:MAG TPA: clan AA aspartic protease [Pyrinomonadaceae bacterium]|nr:clan AA aspartic protease [Pyrinomonadaceae bacterium]